MSDDRQPVGTAFTLRDPYAWDDLAALARAGEALGYRALFLPEVGARDTLVALMGLAGETDRLLLGTGVVPLPSRAAQLLAMAAATVADRSGGRLILGVGTGSAAPGALARLRAVVGALRSLLSGGMAELDGERLSAALVPRQPPPIWIAALGPRAVRLAGEVADGVILNWCTPERVALACAEITSAARAAGRDPRAVTVAAYVRAGFGPGGRFGLQRAAGEYAGYPAYARQFAAMGLGDDARAAAAATRPDQVPERLLRSVCLTGDPDDARARLQTYRDAGADLPVVYPALAGAPDPAEARTILEHLAPIR